MENIKSTTRMHPLIATAAVAVILVSAVGVAAITGVLPTSHSSNSPIASIAAPTSPIPTPSASLAAPPSTVTNSPAVTAQTGASGAAHEAAPANRPAAPVTRHRAPRPAPAVAAQHQCDNCGRVEAVQPIQQAAKPSGLGVVAGAVLGGALGNQVGNGNGRTLATVAGAVGGGYAGNEVEKRTRSTTSYEVRVRMEDGSTRTFPYAAQPGWSVGDHVKVVNGALTSRG